MIVGLARAPCVPAYGVGTRGNVPALVPVDNGDRAVDEQRVGRVHGDAEARADGRRAEAHSDAAGARAVQRLSGRLDEDALLDDVLGVVARVLVVGLDHVAEQDQRTARRQLRLSSTQACTERPDPRICWARKGRSWRPRKARSTPWLFGRLNSDAFRNDTSILV